MLRVEKMDFVYELIVFENDTLLSIIEYINILLFACTLPEADSCRLYFLIKKESDQSNNPCLNYYDVLIQGLAVRIKKKKKLFFKSYTKWRYLR